MMRTTLTGLAVLAVCLLAASPASAGIAEELTAVKGAANALINGGTLEKKAANATQKVISAVDKAEAFADDAAKYWKKAAVVLKKTDSAAKKGADLSASAAGLLQSLVDESAFRRETAVTAQGALFVDKDKTKVGKTIGKGDSKETKADQKDTDGSKGKLYAAAAKLFLKAQEDGVKLRQQEIDKGLVTFEVVSTSLDAAPNLIPGEPIELVFNLPVDPGTVNSDNISIVEDASGVTVPTQFAPPNVPDENRLLAFPEPGQLIPGQTYTLTIHGIGTDTGIPMESREGIALNESFTLQFTVVQP